MRGLPVNTRTAPEPSGRYIPLLERQAQRHVRSFHFLPLLSPLGLGVGRLQRNRTLQALRDPRPIQFLAALPDPRERGRLPRANP